mgnify:CR=1 FL=1
MAIGFDVGGSLGVVVPDKGVSRSNTPNVLKAQFGDGYQQRIALGINSIAQEFSVSFANRAKADIDDIVTFFEGKKGVTAFTYISADSNSGSSEESVKVVCTKWDQTWSYGDFYSLTATFERVYES